MDWRIRGFRYFGTACRNLTYSRDFVNAMNYLGVLLLGVSDNNAIVVPIDGRDLIQAKNKKEHTFG